MTAVPSAPDEAVRAAMGFCSLNKPGTLPFCRTHQVIPQQGVCPGAYAVAAAVVAALDLPARDRGAAAPFRVAAELTIQDVRAQRGDHIAGLVEDSFAAHFSRAADLRESR